MNASKIGSIPRVSWKIMEEFTCVHNRRPAACIKLFQDTARPWKVDRVFPNVYILPPIFHVCYNPPLARLAWLGDREQGAVCFHRAALGDRLKHPNGLELINEGSCQIDLLFRHWCIFDYAIVWFGQEVHRASIAEILPMFGGKLPPEKL
jgi:hypothetical protein